MPHSAKRRLALGVIWRPAPIWVGFVSGMDWGLSSCGFLLGMYFG